MPAYLLINLSIQLDIVNKAGTIIYRVISDPKSNCKLFWLGIYY